jgi:hypothetical protein
VRLTTKPCETTERPSDGEEVDGRASFVRRQLDASLTRDQPKLSGRRVANFQSEYFRSERSPSLTFCFEQTGKILANVQEIATNDEFCFSVQPAPFVSVSKFLRILGKASEQRRVTAAQLLHFGPQRTRVTVQHAEGERPQSLTREDRQLF